MDYPLRLCGCWPNPSVQIGFKQFSDKKSRAQWGTGGSTALMFSKMLKEKETFFQTLSVLLQNAKREVNFLSNSYLVANNHDFGSGGEE